jgi:hypothetical protein
MDLRLHGQLYDQENQSRCFTPSIYENQMARSLSPGMSEYPLAKSKQTAEVWIRVGSACDVAVS